MPSNRIHTPKHRPRHMDEVLGVIRKSPDGMVTRTQLQCSTTLSYSAVQSAILYGLEHGEIELRAAHRGWRGGFYGIPKAVTK